MKKFTFISLIGLMVILTLSACGSKASNEAKTSDYPNKAIQIVVPWGAGGDTDAINRLVAKELENILDTDVVVKNVSGGSGVVGAQQVLNADNDGYTLLSIHDSVAMSQLTGQSDFGYFDFEPIALMTSTYDAVATNPDSPWDSMEDVVEYAKENPGEISYAASIGSTSQLEPALIETAAGIDFNIVGYDGTAKRMKAVVGKDVDLGGVSVVAGKDYLDDNRMKLLGYTGEERSPVLPDLPTLKEQGIDVVSATNRGLVAPKGTPKEIIEKLSNALEEVATSEAFTSKMEELSTDVNFKATEAYNEFLKKNEKDMKKSLKKSGLLAE
ncbi:tripartite tricarboxylate transporter substrate binding protein [Aquibacillus sp. 3ASR75-11]|uniref:Tripartite tricarboxylate transporter substrate binding protein n=1 Tax=Terrihalobacillus insolitus TaxID=2950438 RepID=A0A9X3WTV1_9BACI|nr:tripartite tricarboxylate transporter substrate binding protein [Terrihalobacillus insolitus]MDC3412078.1 tripartite tricarboxylate transporter substrate binding protein [Terrihalobacillus insolitus]MDC3423229.1 tripartite tricarboxylate transporter substrate binding protein [Terrihalobacillus insolitus]